MTVAYLDLEIKQMDAATLLLNPHLLRLLWMQKSIDIMRYIYKPACCLNKVTPPVLYSTNHSYIERLTLSDIY
jgi:predicted CDP-diglyceride synthetase/phosphatidate cytidylyltransferase